MRKRWVIGATLVALMLVAFFGMRRPAEGPVPDFEDAPVRVRIVLSERHLYLEERGDTTAHFGVAIGAPGHATPRGDFGLQRIIWNPGWVPPDSDWARGKQAAAPGDPNNPMGRVKVFFREPTYYLHGTNDERSIGSAASHGCVRLRNEDVIGLARLLMDRGGANVEPGLIRRLINRVRETREVRLEQAIPLRIEA